MTRENTEAENRPAAPATSADDERRRQELVERARREVPALREQVAAGLAGLHRIASQAP
jgi:hypothetical protein